MVIRKNKRSKNRHFTKADVRRLKNEGIAVIFFGGAILGLLLAVNAPAAVFRPQVTTMFLHYNLQYRAGNIEVENTILNDSLRTMLGIFDRHPNWKYTIEIQSYAIERLLNESDKFPGILEVMQRQVHRGQLELICGLYSSQIINAYPQDPLRESVRITKEILDRANLTRSRVMLFQEGQFAPGLAALLNESYWAGVDTVIISQQQLMDFWPKWQPAPPKDVPLFISHFEGKQMYILRYDYLPRVELGMYHGWVYWSDAELALEYADTPEGKTEFTVDPEHAKNFEAHFANLERLGNKFMTVQEWMELNLEKGNYMDLGHYHMSTHWGPTKYDTCYIWFGNNKGNVDDGDMLANNYRGRNVLAATRVLYTKYIDQLSPENQTIVRNLLESATRHMILAMVTDTTGINPNPMEREYGYSNIRATFENCTDIVRIFVENIAELNGAERIQVNLATGEISTSPETLLKYLDTFSLESLNDQLPLNIVPETTGEPPSIKGSVVEFMNYTLKELDIIFPGSDNWSIREADVAVNFEGNMEQIRYCPPLMEWADVKVNRSDYIDEDILNIHIPLSNGLIFIPDAKDSDTGVAIIHNTSRYQIAPRWTSDRLRYMTGKIVLNASFQFFIMENTSIEIAKMLANRINNNVTWIVSPDVTQMQGFEYLAHYFTMDRGDQWSHDEWWR